MENTKEITLRVIKHDLIDWKTLTPFQPKNLKTLTKENYEKIKNSFIQKNFIEGFSVWDDGKTIWILNGHHRKLVLETMEKEGYKLPTKLPCEFIECKNKKEAAELILTYSSRYAKPELEGVEEFIYSHELDIASLIETIDIPDIDLRSLLGKEPEPEGEEDLIPDVLSEAVTKTGDLWVLGSHRLLCGDSTSIDAIDKLMDGKKADMVFTDPPYGVNATGGRTQTVKRDKIKKIENDDLSGIELSQFISDALSIIPVKHNASFYVCYDQKTQHEFTGVLKQIKWIQKSTIIWNKNNFGLSGHKGYRPKYELIAFGFIGDDYDWYGGNDQADVWDIARETEREGNHPTPKPVSVIERALLNSSIENHIVVDVFGGSGSTLIGCEKYNRVCYMLELDPTYCDVIIKRWQKLTGKKAYLHENNMTFDELAQ